MATEVMKYHYQTGAGKAIESNVKIALVRISGPKWLEYVVMDGSLVIHKARREEEKHMVPATYRDKPYPIKRAVKIFRHYGKQFGISKAANRWLTEANSKEQDNA